MTASARLDATEHLIDLAQAIQRFEAAGQSAMLSAHSALASLAEQLQDRRAACERETLSLEEALSDCRGDEDADCSWLEAALDEARLAEETARQWVQRCDDAAQAFQANRARFAPLVERHCPRARAFLDEKDQAVNVYAADGAGSSSTPGATAPAGGAPRAIQAGDLAGATVTRINNRAFAEIPLNRIATPAFSPGEWEEADLADMQRSFARLPAVLQAVRAGTHEALIAADPDARRVFDWFFGGDAIRLDGIRNGTFTIGNGQHRLHLAAMLGLRSVPAWLYGLP